MFKKVIKNNLWGLIIHLVLCGIGYLLHLLFMWKYNNRLIYYSSGAIILTFYIVLVLCIGKIKNLDSKKNNILSFSLTFIFIIICWFINYKNIDWGIFAYFPFAFLISILSETNVYKSEQLNNFILLILSFTPTVLMWIGLEIKSNFISRTSAK